MKSAIRSILFLGFIISACSSCSKNELPQTISEKIAGKWYLKNITVKMHNDSLNQSYLAFLFSSENYEIQSIEFNKNGTVKFLFHGPISSIYDDGYWADGSSIILTYPSQLMPYSILSEDTFSITQKLNFPEIKITNNADGTSTEITGNKTEPKFYIYRLTENYLLFMNELRYNHTSYKITYDLTKRNWIEN